MTNQSNRLSCYQIWFFALVLIALPAAAQDAGAIARKGDVYAEKGDWSHALAEYRQAVALSPATADYQARLGKALSQTGKSREAMIAFLEGLRLDPASGITYRSLGDHYLGMRYWNSAEVSYQRAVELWQGDAEAQHGLGLALIAQKRLDRAAVAFAEACKLAPADPKHVFRLGDVQSGQKKWKAAEASIRSALEKSTETAAKSRCVTSLGNIFFAQSRWADAAREYQKASSLDPKDGRSLANLAAAQYRLGARSEAWRLAHQALSCGYAGPHMIYTELGIDLQPVSLRATGIRRHRRLRPIDANLLSAVESQDLERVRAALAAGASPEANSEGKRAIEIAVAVGDVATIKTLLDHGARGDAAPSGGEAPLVTAIRSGNLDAVDALLGAGVDTECGPQGSALLTTIGGRSDDDAVAIVRALVRAGAEVNVRLETSGLTPLMWAARSNSVKLVELLIAAGADAAATDLKQKTAVDYVPAGAGGTARYLADFVASTPPEAPANSIRLAPGADLFTATRKAQSGQTIVLGAGAYSGPIDVRGKTLTIIGDSEGRTKITAHPDGKPRLFRGGDPFVLVGKGGTLNLWFSRFDTTPAGNSAIRVIDGGVLRIGCSLFENLDKTACAVTKAQLFVTNCRFEKLTCSTAISVDESSCSVRDTQFESLAGSCIQAAKQSTVTAANVSFTGAQSGISGYEQSTLRVSHCEFSEVVRGVQGIEVKLFSVRDSQFAAGWICYASEVDRIVLVRNRLHNIVVAADSNAIYLQSSKNIIVTDNRLEGVTSAIIVKDSVGAPAVFSRNTIRRTDRAIAIVGKSRGVRPLCHITSNWLLGSGSAESKGRFGLLLDGEMHVLVAGNVVLQRVGTAVVVQAQASARLVRNLLSSAEETVRFHKTLARNSILTEELLDGRVKTYQSGNGPVRLSATDKLDTFMEWSPRAERLKRVITSNPFAADLADEDLSAFCATVDAERFAVAAEASQYGAVRLEVRDRVGRTGGLPCRAYDRQSPRSGDTTFTRDQIVDAKRMVRKWKAEDLAAIEDPIERLIERSESTDKVLVYLRENSHRATQRLVAAYAVGSEPSEVLVLAIVAELNRFLGSTEFTDDAGSKADENVAILGKCWTGWRRVHAKGVGVEEKKRRTRTFNRKLLDNAFRFGVAQSSPITQMRTGLTLPAGAYVLKSDGYTNIVTEAVFGPGLDATARVSVNDGLWITYDGKTRELLRLRQRYEMQRAIGRLRFEWSRRGFAMRLADASAASIANALELARGKLAATVAKRRYDHFYLPMRILSAVGELADQKLVLAVCSKAAGGQPWTFAEKLEWAAVFGRIDAAGGHLAAGGLTALLTHADRDWAVAAAIELHRNGVTAGDDLLRDELSRSESFARCAPVGLVLLDSVDPQTLAAMRALWDRMIGAQEVDLSQIAVQNPSIAPTLYLLAFGDRDDWRRVSSLTLSPEHNRYLTNLAQNPGRLMRRAAQDLNIGLSNSERFYRLAEGFLDRTASERARFLPDFDRQSSAVIFAQSPRTRRDSPYNTSRMYMSPFLPNRTAAAIYASIGRWGPMTTPHPRLTWWKNAHFIEAYVARWLAGRNTYLDHLSYFSPELIAGAVAEQGGGKKPADYDLFMAYLRVATREHTHTYLRSAGVDSRPYLARHGSESGVSGVVDLRFDLKGEGLEIGIRIDQNHKFAGVALMEDPESYRAHYPYVQNGGKKMIQSVTLRKGTQRIEATDKKIVGGDSFLLFEAPMGTHDLSGWYLDVDMKYVTQEFTLTTPLFFGENARRLRTAKSQIAR